MWSKTQKAGGIGEVMKTGISLSTLKRLPIYLHYLKSLSPSQTHVSATQVAQALNLGQVQVRKDLASIGEGGKPKIGYLVQSLKTELEKYLGIDVVQTAIMVGVGKLGQALLEYHGFSEFGLEIVAGFDVNEKIVGESIGNKPIKHADAMQEFVKSESVDIGIIAVPATSAQRIADELVSAGIKGIWNFSPTHIVVPDSVTVKNENLAASLAVLSKQIKEKK